jgi:hypothetical protein
MIIFHNITVSFPSTQKKGDSFDDLSFLILLVKGRTESKFRPEFLARPFTFLAPIREISKNMT